MSCQVSRIGDAKGVLACMAALCVLAASPVHAQEWPTRTLTTRRRAASVQAIDMAIQSSPCVRPRTNVSGSGLPAAKALSSSAR